LLRSRHVAPHGQAKWTKADERQFGHNDQKKDRGISDSQFSANLRRMASDVVARGGTPVCPQTCHWHLLTRPQILVTPLTRRSFSGSAPADNLARQRELTLSAARAGGIKVIDLNSASRKYVAAIGKAAAARYNLKDGDNTHLNAHGSKVFGRMVADLIVQAVPDLKAYFREDAAMTAAIRNGRPG
jgi:lysophospholipase L1-like esterase